MQDGSSFQTGTRSRTIAVTMVPWTRRYSARVPMHWNIVFRDGHFWRSLDYHRIRQPSHHHRKGRIADTMWFLVRAMPGEVITWPVPQWLQLHVIPTRSQVTRFGILVEWLNIGQRKFLWTATCNIQTLTKLFLYIFKASLKVQKFKLF